ncbi:MAG: SH3 domain-containing protein, partial [Anaerolineae bacterium]|nr:SH3 domain-containing protein [Anaerolineae bacterium]
MLRFTRCFIVILVLSNVLIFPIQAQDVCGLASRLRIGALGRVMPGDPNNLRAEPSRSSANIGSIAGGGTFVVLDGPICADGAYWWRVNYNGLIGWTVEGSEGMYWIEPVQPIRDLQVMLGQPAQTREELVLYSQPAYQAQELARIPGETQLEIGTDFYCEDEYQAWVSASYQGQIGWLSTLSQFDSGYGGSSSALEPRPRPLEPVADASERLLPISAIELNLAPNAITADNVQTIELITTLGEGKMTAFTWSPDGKQIAIATTLEARVYPSHNFNAAPVQLDGHEGNLKAVSYSPDGRYLVTGDTSGRLIVRDAVSFAEIQRLEADTGILAVRFSPDSHSLAVVLGVNFTTQVIVFHLDDHFTEAFRLPNSASAPQNSLTFSQNSQRLITVDSGSVRVWDNRSGEEVMVIDKGTGAPGIGDWVLSSDDRLITVFDDGMVGDVTHAHYYSLQTWNLETGEALEGSSTSLTLPERVR